MRKQRKLLLSFSLYSKQPGAKVLGGGLPDKKSWIQVTKGLQEGDRKQP